MLPAQDAAGARSQKQEQCSGVLQEEGRMPEHDKEATDMQTKCARAAVAKHTRVCQGLNDPQLHRPQQKQVSILDDLVGEEASLSTIRGGARCSTLQVQDRPRQQQHCSQDSHTFVIASYIL